MSDEVGPRRVSDEVAHKSQLDAKGRQCKSEQRERDELCGSQAAGQEATPEEVWQAEEGAEEGVGAVQVQAGQQLHAKHMERCLQQRSMDYLPAYPKQFRPILRLLICMLVFLTLHMYAQVRILLYVESTACRHETGA